VIPLDAVRECIRLPPTTRTHATGTGILNLRGIALPYVRLRDLFELEGGAAEAESVVIVEHDGARAGLAVEGLRGESQAVIKPLGRLFEGRGLIAGSTILGDGRVALILDVPSVIATTIAEQRRAAREVAA
jgi:two-component system chemotaxis sensor kinase CheA